MVQLIKVASWTGKPRGHVIFAHGLGGHAYDTWRRRPDDDSFWPVWLARDIPGVAVWTLGYAAPPTNWLGNALPLQDRAVSVLERLLSQADLDNAPVSFVCHSLGGLLVKQMLRAADGQRAAREEAADFLNRMRSVTFIATPHAGSAHADVMDLLRLAVWPSAATKDLVKNDAHLRELNSWYRNWSGKIAHKIFYETREALAGTIVEPASAEAGLPGVVLVPIEADHMDICKPANDKDLVYSATKSFLVKHAVVGTSRQRSKQQFNAWPLEAAATARPNLVKPIALRLLMLGCLAVFFLFFWSDAISRVDSYRIRTAISQAEENFRKNQPNLTRDQINQFVSALRKMRGAPGFEYALEQAKKGNTDAANEVWITIFNKGRAEAAAAARGMAAISQMNNLSSIEALKWYRIATELQPDNPDGWLGLGNAAKVASTTRNVNCDVTGLGNRAIPEPECAFRRYIDLIQKSKNKDVSKEIIGLFELGDYQMGEKLFAAARNTYRRANVAAARLVRAAPSEASLQRILARSFRKLGGALAAEGKNREATEAYEQSAEIVKSIGAGDENTMRVQIDEARLIAKHGDTFLMNCDFPAAQSALEQARDIQLGLREGRPEHIGHKIELVWTLGKLGEAYWRDGKLRQARSAYSDAEELARPLADANRTNADRQNNLWWAYFSLARVAVDEEDFADGLRQLVAAEEISKRLLKIDPLKEDYHHGLAIVHLRLAEVQTQLDRQAAAEASRTKARQILDKLGVEKARLPNPSVDCPK